MNNKYSRREFFAFLTSPVTRTAIRVAATEQRARAVLLLTQADAKATCVRCCAPYHTDEGEALCPDCRAAEAKNQELMLALFKDQ